MISSTVLKAKKYSQIADKITGAGKARNSIVFCDFDGPVVDVSDRYYHTYKLCLSRIKGAANSKKLSKKQFWQMKCDRVSDVEIAQRSGLTKEQTEPFLAEVRKIVNHPILLQQDKIQPGVKRALSMLRSQRAKLVLVTLRCQSQVEGILKAQGLESLFSGIYGRKDTESAYQNNAEHKTELLKEAIGDHSGSSSDCMVGDTEADIIAAKQTGIKSIALTCGIRSHRYLSKYQPDRLHENLLSTAHHLVGSRV